MKQSVSPVVLGVVALLVLAIAGFFAYRMLGDSGQTVTPTSAEDKNRPQEINGQKVPAGVPYDYARPGGAAAGGGRP